MNLHSPLHSEHVRRGAQFIDYFGWQVPAVYSTENDELATLRTGAGIAEYAFMRHAAVSGPDAARLLQRTLSRDISRQQVGRAFHALALNDAGGVVEDVIVFRLRADFFIISGRGRFDFHDEDRNCLLAVKANKPWLDARAADLHACVSTLGLELVSVQGPLSSRVLAAAGDIDDLSHLDCKQMHLNGIPSLVARTGYSGELGFEILVWPEYSVELWRLLERVGAPYGIAPCGANLLKTISLEKGYLGGTDYYVGSTPVELGLARAVDLDTDEDFTGKAALIARMARGTTAKLVGMELVDTPAPAAERTTIRLRGNEVGRITASAYSGTLRKSLARGWVAIDQAEPGTRLEVETHAGIATATIAASYCWYDRDNTRLKPEGLCDDRARL